MRISTKKEVRLAQIPQTEDTLMPSDAASSYDQSSALEGVKILLVEDSDDNRVLIQTYLKGAGAIVECAHDGREGVERTLQSDVDIVLMDISMPIMDGYEAASQLRKKGFKKPIVAITAHVMEEARQDIAAAGFNDRVFKPIDRANLIRRLADLSNAAYMD